MMETQDYPEFLKNTGNGPIEMVYRKAESMVTGTTIQEEIPTFLSSKTRGIIRFIPSSTNAGVEAIDILAEDVQVEKQVAIDSQSTLGKKQTTVSSDDGSSSTEEEMSQLAIQFKTTFTPQKYSNRTDYISARANFLFNYENTLFTVVSDMFKKATPVQIKNIQYVIPAGEDNAYYTIQLIQVEEAVENPSASGQPEDSPFKTPTGEQTTPILNTMNSVGANINTNQTST
jgi:hypothetical protein